MLASILYTRDCLLYILQQTVSDWTYKFWYSHETFVTKYFPLTCFVSSPVFEMSYKECIRNLLNIFKLIQLKVREKRTEIRSGWRKDRGGWWMRVGCKLSPLEIYWKFSTKMKTIALCPPLQHSISQSVILFKAAKFILFKTIWKHSHWLATGPVILPFHSSD